MDSFDELFELLSKEHDSQYKDHVFMGYNKKRSTLRIYCGIKEKESVYQFNYTRNKMFEAVLNDKPINMYCDFCKKEKIFRNSYSIKDECKQA